MIFPEIKEVNNTFFIIHCSHPDCSDIIAFNDIEDVDRYIYKHSDWYNGCEENDRHGGPNIYRCKRRELITYEDLNELTWKENIQTRLKEH